MRCPVGVSINTGKMAGSAGRAKGYGGEAIGKADAFAGEAVHSRCVDEGMSRTSHAVVSLVVAHGKEDVGLFGHCESPEGVGMSLLTAKDKAFFVENGYLIRHNMLREGQIQEAVDTLWHYIEADRDDPQTWVDAGPRSPDCGDHPAIRATLYETDLFAMCRELSGDLSDDADPSTILVYPSGSDEWAIKLPHLDGYNKSERATVGFTIGVTVYLSDVAPRGGGFTLWPGSHKTVAEFFKSHSLLGLNMHHPGGIVERDMGRIFDLNEPVELVGRAGTACIWHGYMVHSGTSNCSDQIRMALVSRMSTKNWDLLQFETPDDMWEYWEV